MDFSRRQDISDFAGESVRWTSLGVPDRPGVSVFPDVRIRGRAGFRHAPSGQSMVELAIIAPLLIFMLLGVLEVGYALRNYLVIMNGSREGARFAARPEYIQDTGDLEESGAIRVINHTKASMTDILEFGGRDSGLVIVTLVDTEVEFNPCDPSQILSTPDESGDYWPSCDCSLMVSPAHTVTVQHSWQHQYPITYPVGSDIDLVAFGRSQAEFNDEYNCVNKKRHGPNILTSDRDSVVVEVIYEHHQLFGFPLISNPWTDPIYLHSRTIMRRNEVRNLDYLKGLEDGE